MPNLRATIPWLAWILGSAASLGAFAFFRQAEQRALSAEIDRRSQIIANVIQISLRAHEDTLYSLRNLFHYSAEVSRVEFAGASNELVAVHPGIQALEWISRVPGAERSRFEAAVRAEGFAGFEIRQRLDGNTLTRGADRETHYPVTYIHPFGPTRAALGFDLASSPIFPQFLAAARENALATSGRIRLITDGQRQDWGYLLELPVYHLPVPDQPEERLAKLRGFILGIFRLDEIIEGSISRLSPQGLDVAVIDPKAADADRLLHFHPSRLRKGEAAGPEATGFAPSALTRVITLQLPRRSWEIHFRATSGWLESRSSHLPLALLLTGLTCSGLLGFFLRGTLRRTELVEQKVKERTLELTQIEHLLQEDIRRRHKTELALQTSEARLQAIIDNSPALIWVKDLDGRYVLANQAFKSLLLPSGRQPEGSTDRELFPADFARAFREKDQLVIDSDESQTFEEVAQVLDGERRVFLTQKFLLRDATGKPYAVGGLATDISASKASEEARLSLQKQLLEAKKLEALGVLAGGIAHDFNNLLTSVLGNASLTRAVLGPMHPAQPQVEQIEHAARRAADLCAQMLAYAGKGNFVTAPIDLSRLVRDTAALLQVSLHKGTQLQLELAAVLPAVLADATQIRQIAMNLILNAADAIGPRPDGVITISSFTRELSADFFRTAVQHPDLPAGRYVGLSVKDNGSGMAPETLARIFEPFFTTKFSGRGLGLAAVLGIVNSHRGALFVDSTLGTGTSFQIFFPALAAAAAAPLAPTLAVKDRASLRGTVLLVDDEAAVSLVAKRMFERLGIKSFLAASGNEALEICRKHGSEIDLILLDLTMPGLTGEETLRELKPLGLRARIVIMSGYSESDVMARCADLGASGFLHKPFEIDQLLDVLRRWLA